MLTRPSRVTKIDIAPRTVIFVGAVIAGCWLLRELWTIAVLVLVALMLVGTLSPIVGALERRKIGRTWALLIVFMSLLAALSLLLLVTVPPLIGQLLTLLADAPARRDELVGWLEQHRLLEPLAGPVRDAGVDGLTAEAGIRLLGYSSRIVVVLGYGLTAVFLAFYLLADGPRAKGALFALVPRTYHLRLARILMRLQIIVGGYVRGQLITSAAITGFMFVLLTILGVPNALSLAVFAGLIDVIPFVGGIIATAPAIAMAATQGSGAALVVAVAMVIYLQFAGKILVPRVYGRVLRLSPAAVMIALLIGGTLLGIIGALLALPVAAGLRMIAQQLRVELPGDDRSDPEAQAREEAAERRYHEQSAGAAPVTAAAVAAAVALDADRAYLRRSRTYSVVALKVPPASPAVVEVSGAMSSAAILDAMTPAVASASSPEPQPRRPARRGGGGGGRRADRADLGPRRRDRPPGSWARPTGRRR